NRSDPPGRTRHRPGGAGDSPAARPHLANNPRRRKFPAHRSRPDPGRGGPPRYPIRRGPRRHGSHLRLVESRRLNPGEDNPGRGTRRRQRAASHRRRATLGRRRLLAHRVFPRTQGPRENGAIPEGSNRMNTEPDAGGHFGVYGGRYVPEVLMSPLEELEIAYRQAQLDPAFHAELDDLLHTYAGRP